MYCEYVAREVRSTVRHKEASLRGAGGSRSCMAGELCCAEATLGRGAAGSGVLGTTLGHGRIGTWYIAEKNILDNICICAWRLLN